jgi:hypothetical protein
VVSSLLWLWCRWAEWAASHYNASNNQLLITIPYAVHASAFPGRSETTSSPYSCGMEIAASFFLQGGVDAPDTSCLKSLVPPDFAAVRNSTQAMSELLLGTTDAWGVSGL